MVRKLFGDIYENTITLSHTNAHQIEKNSMSLAMLWLYTKTQNCYVGRQGSQGYLLQKTNTHSSTYALVLANVDLSDLYLKAAASGAEVHMIGTYLAEKELRAALLE